MTAVVGSRQKQIISANKTRNTLILLDVWENLDSAIEEQAKVQICDFLSKIKTLNNWRVFYYNSDIAADKRIFQCLEDCNGLLTNNPYLIYEDLIEGNEWFYFGGFHTNLCVLYNHIGIEALHSIADANFHNCYNVLEDCTVALDTFTNIPISPRKVNDKRIIDYLIHSDEII